jgi:hypothetical protein
MTPQEHPFFFRDMVVFTAKITVYNMVVNSLKNNNIHIKALYVIRVIKKKDWE